MEKKYLSRWISVVGFSWIFTVHTRLAGDKRQCRFSCDRSITKGTLLGEESSFRPNLGFHLRDVSETLQVALFALAIQTAQSGCAQIKIAFSAVHLLPLEELSWHLAPSKHPLQIVALYCVRSINKGNVLGEQTNFSDGISVFNAQIFLKFRTRNFHALTTNGALFVAIGQ